MFSQLSGCMDTAHLGQGLKMKYMCEASFGGDFGPKFVV